MSQPRDEVLPGRGLLGLGGHRPGARGRLRGLRPGHRGPEDSLRGDAQGAVSFRAWKGAGCGLGLGEGIPVFRVLGKDGVLGVGETTVLVFCLSSRLLVFWEKDGWVLAVEAFLVFFSQCWGLHVEELESQRTS